MNRDLQTVPQGHFRDQRRRRMLSQVSEDAPGKRKAFERAYSGQASPRHAIKAKCLECCWLDEQAIRECSAPDCPLWEYRPYQGNGGPK